MSHEEALVQQLAELQVRLQYLESVYRSRKEDVATILMHQQENQQQQSSILTANGTTLLATHQPPFSIAVQAMLKNMTGSYLINII